MIRHILSFQSTLFVIYNNIEIFQHFCYAMYMTNSASTYEQHSYNKRTLWHCCDSLYSFTTKQMCVSVCVGLCVWVHVCQSILILVKQALEQDWTQLSGHRCHKQ